jgi:prevent-host-death family protein
MIKVSLKEAEGHLGELIKEAAAGQEVVITSAGGPTVRLTLVPQEEQESRADGPAKAVGHALDRFIGTWSAEQEAEVLRAIEIFESSVGGVSGRLSH